MVAGVDEDHRPDRVEDIRVHVEDGQDRGLDAVPDQGKDIEVEIGVPGRGKGHDLEKSPNPKKENANCLGKDGDHDLNLINVARDLEVIKKTKKILPKKKKTNPKNVEIKIRKKKPHHLWYLKLRKKINQLHPKKKYPGQLHHQEVILEVRDLLVNHQEEVVRLVEENHLNRLKVVRLAILDIHCLQKDLGQEPQLISVLVGLHIEVERLRNVIVGNQILLNGVQENVAQVTISHVHLLKKGIDVYVHLNVDLHLPDHLLLEELQEHRHREVHNLLQDL